MMYGSLFLVLGFCSHAMLNLLIYIDGTAASQHAVDYILPITHRPNVAVTVLTAQQDTVRAADLYSKVAGKFGTLAVRHVNRPGPADTALCAEASEGSYDLAVFAPMRERWSRWIKLGSRPSLSAELPISSLLVRGAAERITRVLICAGGDKTVITDAKLTARLAQRAGASATVLHVLSQMPLIFGMHTPEERAAEAFAATGAPEIANMKAAVAVLGEGGVQAEIKVRIGMVIDEIVAELQDGGYDLLVIGAHRSQGLVERLLLEDVTAGILGHSPVPVLVVKAFDVEARSQL